MKCCCRAIRSLAFSPQTNCVFSVWAENAVIVFFGEADPRLIQNPMSHLASCGILQSPTDCPGCKTGRARISLRHAWMRGLVLGVEEPFGISPVSGVEAFLLAAEIILDAKGAVAPEHSIPCPLDFLMVVRIPPGANCPLADSDRIRAESA